MKKLVCLFAVVCASLSGQTTITDTLKIAAETWYVPTSATALKVSDVRITSLSPLAAISKLPTTQLSQIAATTTTAVFLQADYLSIYSPLTR